MVAYHKAKREERKNQIARLAVERKSKRRQLRRAGKEQVARLHSPVRTANKQVPGGQSPFHAHWDKAAAPGSERGNSGLSRFEHKGSEGKKFSLWGK